ncbi:MAG: glycosyltransferase, partial [Clostridia bacterium]|nr:glycosyltransferase [Clostridia bacterium]
MSKHVVMINTGPFPEGDAGAVRLFYTAKALTLAGYTVEVLCRGKKRDRGSVDGIAYRSLRYADRSRLLRGLDYCRFPARVRAHLRRHAAEYLYLYDAQPSLFRFCKAFARKHGVKVLYDCVEWYSPEQFAHGENSAAYRNKNAINTEIVDQSFSVIAISRYLERYYAEKGIHTLRLPILCDGEEMVSKAPSGDRLTLFYAGAPHRKDLVGNVLEAARLLTAEERARLSIVLVGVNRQSLIETSGISAKT